MPAIDEESPIESITRDIAEIPELELELEASALSLVVAGSRSDLPEDMSDNVDRMVRRMPTTVFDGTEPDGRVGRDAYQGPGRSGTRNVLYFQTGDTYTRIRAKEAPETPPSYGVIVVEAEDVSDEALAFLRSLADLPVMPLWR
jgi:hypothetical protein